MKKIAVNAKHLLVKNMLKCLSVYTLKSKDATSHHPTVDMLTKPSFIIDSQPSMHGPSVTLIRRLVQNTLENPISPQTYIHLVLRIYTSSYLAKKKITAWHESVFCPFEKRVNLSFFHGKNSQSYSDQHVSYDASARAIN